MKFSEKNVAGGLEILAADNFTAIPIKLAATSGTIPAGTPLTAAGVAALDGTNAVGILLYDANPADNPNVAMVVSGVIDYNKIVGHAGVTASASTLHSAIPGVYFRTDVPEAINWLTAFTLSVTAPVKAATPQTTIASGTGYTGDITWSPADDAFSAATVYTATINLYAGDEYAISDIYTVSGLSAATGGVTLSGDSGKATVVAVYPATSA